MESQSTSIGNEFSVKQIGQPTGKDYTQALSIYNDVTSNDIKTPVDQITKWLRKGAGEYFQPYGFILYLDKTVSGFALVSYLKKSKTMLIEYLALKSEFNTNAAFFEYMNLLQSFFSNTIRIDIDYWTVEISNKNNGQDVDKESKIFKKFIYLEAFGIAKASYYTLPLSTTDTESNFPANLYLKSNDQLNHINKETYLKLVTSIYDYSSEWYSLSYPHETDYYQKLKRVNLNRISQETREDNIPVHTVSIVDKSSSDQTNTAKTLPTNHKSFWSTKGKWIAYNIVIALIVFVLTSGFVKLNHLSGIASVPIIIALITTIVTPLFHTNN